MFIHVLCLLELQKMDWNFPLATSKLAVFFLRLPGTSNHNQLFCTKKPTLVGFLGVASSV